MDCVAVDLGNTNVTVARVRGGRTGRMQRFATGVKDTRAIRRLLRQCLGRSGADVGGIVCSVVPRATERWTDALHAVTGKSPVVVSHRSRLGVGIDYPAPGTIGADRLANACGAVDLHGAPVIVADFGTALTFDIIDKRASYVGGVIAPGLPLMVDYLHDRTALLPRIRLEGSVGQVGRSTAGAMRIGAQVGYRGIVREIVTHLRRDPGMANAALCATGGHAAWVLRGVDMPFHFEPKLTLHELGVIYRLNSD